METCYISRDIRLLCDLLALAGAIYQNKKEVTVMSPMVTSNGHDFELRCRTQFTIINVEYTSQWISQI